MKMQGVLLPGQRRAVSGFMQGAGIEGLGVGQAEGSFTV